ncbi:MAG: NAD-dependent epimerase/dehydratase family protein [Bacteroidales bacterium]|nr:NAD-dependent epimerase/dehydratase family protein [Bacteroidales bacterium]MDZ4204524.1 NAD-dependent epimerase/dehydratase family protein [Bacteroidales bacterium]
MKVLITGSTGFIGSQLTLKLANLGHTVHALYRSASKTAFIRHQNILLFKGDILDKDSLRKAMTGCSQIYHTAAFTEVWAKDESLITKLNVDGTLNVLDIAAELGISDIVFTSSAGVFGPSLNGCVTEKTVRQLDYFVEYERTKAIAEDRAKGYAKRGLNIRIVNPTRTYGPGLLSTGNSVTILIDSYIRGNWRLNPGNGESIGNYVFIDDVVNGHILAMEKGNAGENYLLGGENVSYNEMFKLISEVSGKRRLLIKIPLPLMLGMVKFLILLNKVVGIKPFITHGLVKKFNYNWQISSLKAERELGYSITPLEEGIRRTINWINKT